MNTLISDDFCSRRFGADDEVVQNLDTPKRNTGQVGFWNEILHKSHGGLWADVKRNRIFCGSHESLRCNWGMKGEVTSEETAVPVRCRRRFDNCVLVLDEGHGRSLSTRP